MNTSRVEAMKQFGFAVERAIVALEGWADAIDKANPGDPYASLMLREDIETLRQGVQAITAEARGDDPLPTTEDIDGLVTDPAQIEAFFASDDASSIETSEADARPFGGIAP